MSRHANPAEVELQRAADIISSADTLVITAGAGIGVDSGMPDFRGNGGFWRAYPALAQAQVQFTDVACPDTFRRDPALAWGFYGHRLNLYRKVEPHRGFGLLKQWSDATPLRGWVFTSNVDGQFQKAGFDAAALYECHGSIHHLQCLDACSADIWSADGFEPVVDEDACRLFNAPPTCAYCGGLARPNVLMFGDVDWIASRSRAQRLRQERWLDTVHQSKGSVAIIEIGAGTAIPSVRMFGHHLIREHGAKLVRINPREPAVPSARDVGLGMGAVQALEQIAARLQSARWRD